MKNLFKVSALLVALVMLITLTACTSTDEGAVTPNETEVASVWGVEIHLFRGQTLGGIVIHTMEDFGGLLNMFHIGLAQQVFERTGNIMQHGKHLLYVVV